MNVIIRVFFITTYWIIQFFYSHLNLYPRNTVCFNYFNSTFPSWWWMSKIRFGDGQLQKVIKPRSSMLLIWCSKLLQHEGYAYIEQEENGQNIDIITIFRSSILCTFGHPSYPWILPKHLPEDDSHIFTGENKQYMLTRWQVYQIVTSSKVLGSPSVEFHRDFVLYLFKYFFQ